MPRWLETTKLFGSFLSLAKFARELIHANKATTFYINFLPTFISAKMYNLDFKIGTKKWPLENKNLLFMNKLEAFLGLFFESIDLVT
jgi:hypothetical protein